MDYIKRNFPAEFRADETDRGLIRGVPIVFDTPTDIGGWFEEVIEAGAIDDSTIDSKADVRMFWNHDLNGKTLARTQIPLDKKGGLVLESTKKGVDMQARLNLDRSDANDLYLGIEEGTINAMSFMFGVAEEEWERMDTDYPKRTIKKISPIVEVSAVNFPAYKTTSISASRADASTEIDTRALESARSKRLEDKQSADTDKLELEKLKIEILSI